jgi:CarboxypepD_reg-like domain
VMITRNIILLTIFNCVSFLVFSQDIEGIVMDSITREPIPYAHIFSEKFEIATISNEEGKFIFKKKEDDIEIVFSHISYKGRRVVCKDNEYFLSVSLLPNETILSEVVVGDKVYEIAKKAFYKFKEHARVHFGRAFYRQTTRNGEKPTEFIETFNNVSFSSTGVEKYGIYQSRFAKLKFDADNPSMSFANFSYLTFAFNIYSRLSKDMAKPFTPQHFDDFSYSIKSYFEKDGVRYALLEYEPISSLKKPSFFGTFTVNLASNSIINFVANTKNSLGVDTLTVTKDGKVLKKISAVNHSFKWILNFSDLNGDVQLEYINVTGSFDWLKDKKLETTKLTSTLIVFEKDNKKKKGLKEPDIKQNDIAAVKKVKYNPKFWKDNPVVKRTQSEEDIVSQFEKSNSFGNYFDK